MTISRLKMLMSAYNLTTVAELALANYKHKITFEVKVK